MVIISEAGGELPLEGMASLERWPFCSRLVSTFCDGLKSGGGAGIGFVEVLLFRRFHKASTSIVAASEPLVPFFL